MSKSISDAIIDMLKRDAWRDSEDIQPMVFKFMTEHFSAECIKRSPQTYIEAYVIIKECDGIWRRAAKEYHSAFGKLVLDFDYFSNSLISTVKEHYTSQTTQQ